MRLDTHPSYTYSWIPWTEFQISADLCSLGLTSGDLMIPRASQFLNFGPWMCWSKNIQMLPLLDFPFWRLQHFGNPIYSSSLVFNLPPPKAPLRNPNPWRKDKYPNGLQKDSTDQIQIRGKLTSENQEGDKRGSAGPLYQILVKITLDYKWFYKVNLLESQLFSSEAGKGETVHAVYAF